jgi:hypothetical protein
MSLRLPISVARREATGWSYENFSENELRPVDSEKKQKKWPFLSHFGQAP